VHVDRHRVRRPLGRLFWVAVLLVPALLTALVGTARVAVLEDGLDAQVRAALEAQQLGAVAVTVEGRQVTARVPTGLDPEATARAVEAVPGVLAVSTLEVYASAAEEKACTNLQAKVDWATKQQRIPFSGSSAAPTHGGRTMLTGVAKLLKACRAADAVVGGHADSSARDAGALSLRRARTMIAVLVEAGVAQERLEPRGYGDQFEVDDASTATARAKNQRGTVVVKGTR
jgi:outer membrane protein OmpA-like peptidoglycan-associated protein